MSSPDNEFRNFPKQIQYLMESFEDLPDPRQNRGKRHLLVDVVMLSLLAMMSDQDDAEGFEEWGRFNVNPRRTPSMQFRENLQTRNFSRRCRDDIGRISG